LEKLTGAGLEVVDVDTESFMEKAKTVHGEFASKSPEAQELYDSIVNTK
jgi:TRAP-type transport system periplasmic protein